jgi:hypothetical protein
MPHQDLIAKLAAVVARLNAADSWAWPGEEIAGVALRRWSSYARRHQKAKRATADERVLDLAKGLQARFEPDIPYTPLCDWRAFAGALAPELRAGTPE